LTLKSLLSLLGFLISLLLVYSCKKESFTTDPSARIIVSIDSLKFDSVFTQTGSLTKSFKIKNPNNSNVMLASIKLMDGDRSSFKMNVNGVATTEATEVNIAANDSIYVFVMANINPNNSSLPFVVSDSIQIICNNNKYQVQLEAYAQNALFCNNLTISNDTTWTNIEPIVVLGGLTVDSNATLTLQQGCKIYVHANAPILINGTLKAVGSTDERIQFRGDRLDDPYKFLPGSWPGIRFGASSKNNELQFCIIKNAVIALHVENPSINGNPKFKGHQLLIDNASVAGLKVVNSSVSIDNTLISNCKKNVVIENGGNCNFVNCSFTAYPTLYQFHEFPILEMNNYTYQNGNLVSGDLSAIYTNCVVWSGSSFIDNEIFVSKEGNGLFDVSMENCLIKNSINPDYVTLTNVISNIDPQFDSIDIENNYFDFRTQNSISSPLHDAGKLTAFPFDLDNRPRISGSSTDIGCFEKQ
jgi:hypothetical protein